MRDAYMQDAKPIGDVSGYEKAFEEDRALQVVSHALTNNAIESVTQVHTAKAAEQFHFSVNIKTMPAVAQQQSGRCWLFAGLNVLRESVAKKYNLKEFELSQNYTAFWDKYEKINYLLESAIDLIDRPCDDRTLMYILMIGVQDGGQWDMLVDVIDKYGVVPKGVMEETYQSSHTRSMNQLINRRISMYVAQMQRDYKAGKTREQLREDKEGMLKEMYGFLCANFGVPPKHFDFEYTDKDGKYGVVRDLTPLEFLHTYVGTDVDDYVSIINAPTFDKPFHRTYTVDYLGNVIGGKPIQYLNLEMSRVKELIISQLQAGEVVWFGSDVSFEGSREAGIWDDQAFDYETAFGQSFDLTKEEGLLYWRSAMNHAMVITGVNLDADGKPNRWKIENSWGEKAGKKGYYVMSDSWFDRFVYQAVIHKKYLSDEEREEYAMPPVHLDPWDPMGALAD